MEGEKQPAVYMMANRYRGTIYIGVTSSLWSRVWDHKNRTTPGFTSRYSVSRLVWYEHRPTMDSA
ncbi:GIY-YIG nuclease family protein, partial [Nostoc sp. NIES-2111]